MMRMYSVFCYVNTIGSVDALFPEYESVSVRGSPSVL